MSTEGFLLPPEDASPAMVAWVSELNRILTRIGTERAQVVRELRGGDTAQWVSVPIAGVRYEVGRVAIPKESRWLVFAAFVLYAEAPVKVRFDLRAGDEGGEVVASLVMDVEGASSVLAAGSLTGLVENAEGRVTLTATPQGSEASAVVRHVHLVCMSLF